MKRREFIVSSSTLALVPALGIAEAESHLIYLSPVRSDGQLSRCQAEVWYVGHAGDMYVVTASDAWRARAVAQGLTETQVWVGDVGVWSRSRGRYKALPSVRAKASTITNADMHNMLLTQFGRKYADEWGTWGPRFQRGLADGSRVLLRYQPIVT